MQWPNPQEYNEAVQSPHLCFRDADLRTAAVQTNAIGLPRPITGAFASVYKLTAGSKSWAVRLFHRDVPDQKARYSNICACLEALKLPFFAGFRFEDEGVRVKGQWYPMLKMDWVDGVTLDEYLRKNAGNPDKIRQLSHAFRELVESMNARGIAHGDLQHGNLMITPSGLALVDYDGMYVPAMLGWPSAELGHKNYQHPYRSSEHFGDYTDHFSAWLIHVSLMMIAADPDLWRWGKDRECLIFTYADLVKPEESEVFDELFRHEHKEIRDAAQLMIRLANCPVEQVPALSADLASLQDLPQMDFMQQMQLKDKIEQEDASRAQDKSGASAISALETLSVRQQMPKQRINKLWQGVSKVGEAWLTSVVDTLKSNVDAKTLITRANDLFHKGDYLSAIAIYVRVLEQSCKQNLSDEQRKEVLRLQTHLNLQIGKGYVLGGDATKAIFYFRSVMRLKRADDVVLEVMEAAACLLVVYFELNRTRDADALINGEVPVQELSVALVQFISGDICKLGGWTKAMLAVGEHFEMTSEWHRACSIYECALSSGRGARGSEDHLDDATLAVLVRLSRCYLYSERPLIAVRCLQSLVNNQQQLDQDLFERALLNLAVAQRQLGSQQDVLSALFKCSPRGLLRIIRQELRTPLGTVPELADVVNELAMQLGERGRAEEARLAVRLSADIYKNSEFQQRAREIYALLQEGKFEEADAKAQDREIFVIEGVKERFRNAALVHAAKLINDDKVDEAFACLSKYDCPIAVAVSAIEDRVRLCLRGASRDGWEGAHLERAMVMMKELAGRRLLSPDLRQLVVTMLLSEPHQIESLPTAVREFADFFASTIAEGASHPDVLRLRRLALNIEETQASLQVITPSEFLKKEARPTGVGLSGTFSGAIKASTISASDSHNRATMEGEVLRHVSSFIRDGTAVELEMAASKIAEMHMAETLNWKFCDRIAELLVKYFADSSGMRRWRMSAAQLTDDRRQQVENAVVAIMETFSHVPGTASSTTSNLKRCLSFVASNK